MSITAQTNIAKPNKIPNPVWVVAAPPPNSNFPKAQNSLLILLPPSPYDYVCLPASVRVTVELCKGGWFALPNVISQANVAIYSHMPRVHPKKILPGSDVTLPRFDGVLRLLLERYQRLLESSHATGVGT
jgi:hypothetical protein